MATDFESMLTGGHPNSLGRTVAAVETVLANPERFEELFLCYRSSDEVLRLRVSNAMRRVDAEHDDWIVLNNTMEALFNWSGDDADLRAWLLPHLKRLAKDDRKSVAGRAKKLITKS